MISTTRLAYDRTTVPLSVLPAVPQRRRVFLLFLYTMPSTASMPLTKTAHHLYQVLTSHCTCSATAHEAYIPSCHHRPPLVIMPLLPRPAWPASYPSAIPHGHFLYLNIKSQANDHLAPRHPPPARRSSSCHITILHLDRINAIRHHHHQVIMPLMTITATYPYSIQLLDSIIYCADC